MGGILCRLEHFRLGSVGVPYNCDTHDSDVLTQAVHSAPCSNLYEGNRWRYHENSHGKIAWYGRGFHSFLYFVMKTGFVVVIDVIRLAAAASDMARGRASF